jgi:hypothetical protein
MTPPEKASILIIDEPQVRRLIGNLLSDDHACLYITPPTRH